MVRDDREAGEGDVPLVLLQHFCANLDVEAFLSDPR